MSFIRFAKKRPATVICLLLGLITLALYLPIVRDKFTDFDDEAYLTQNVHINRGWSIAGIVWAFKTNYQANWHPLTWISHMIDCQLYGLNPAGHHLTNVLFHIANTLLLFLWLRQLTGAVWRSAIVAAFFGWHPLHVESVAWAAERKDVLCAFFWLLTMMAYTKYVKKPHVSIYLLALILFACALMSKPMAVTLPFVLLLLDFWPLNRFAPANFSARQISANNLAARWKKIFFVVLEKLPFFALTAADSWITYLAQRTGHAIWSPKDLPFSYRAGNALWTYLRYLSNTFWPVDLSIIYPYRRHLPVGLIIISTALLIIWSVLFFLYRKRFPYLIVGWLWFLGTLIPTIGIVQVGAQSMADRYMYLPSIGLFLLVVWGVKDIIDFHPRWRKIFWLGGGAALAACVAATSVQLNYWRDSTTLFWHAVQVTSDNGVAYGCLGKAYDELGDPADAMVLYAQAVKIEPDYFTAQFFFGQALMAAGEYPEAMQHFDQAVKLSGDSAEVEYNIGTAFLYAGQNKKAMDHLKIALLKNPDAANAEENLGIALLNQSLLNDAANHFLKAIQLEPEDAMNYFNLGRDFLAATNLDGAIIQFQKALQLKPDYADAHENLALTFIKAGETNKAIAQYREALRAQPNFYAALNELAWILATNPDPKIRAGNEAVQFAERACELTKNQNPDFLTTLSAAYAETLQFPAAIATAQKARELASAAGQKEIAARDEKLLKLYQTHQPFHGSF